MSNFPGDLILNPNEPFLPIPHTSNIQLKMSAERETQQSVRVFSMLMESIERSQAELLEVIEMNRRSAEHQAEGMIRELEQEVQELRKRSSTLENLLNGDDFVKCLKVSSSKDH